MAGTVTVTQAYNFGALTQQGGSNTYIVACTPDPSTGVYPNQAAVVAAVQAAIPSNSAMFSTWGYVLPLDDIKIEHVTDSLWMAEASFKRPQPKDKQPEDSGPVLDFDTTGGTQHISTSKGQTGYAYQMSPYDPKNVIGWDGKKVRGADIGFAVYRFSEEWTLPDTAASNAVPCKCDATYRAILKGLTYKTNASTFRGFAIGEVLFEGATGRRVKGGAFSVTYKFSVSPNVASMTIGDITGIAKKGWQYLDVRMKTVVAEYVRLAVPEFVFVHDVYDSGDFSTLQIGMAAI